MLTNAPHMNVTDSVNNLLRNAFFGKPRKGEPIFDRQQTFTSTYPQGYDPAGYNRWIRAVYEGAKKRRNSKGELLKF